MSNTFRTDALLRQERPPHTPTPGVNAFNYQAETSSRPLLALERKGPEWEKLLAAVLHP